MWTDTEDDSLEGGSFHPARDPLSGPDSGMALTGITAKCATLAAIPALSMLLGGLTVLSPTAPPRRLVYAMQHFAAGSICPTVLRRRYAMSGADVAHIATRDASVFDCTGCIPPIVIAFAMRYDDLTQVSPQPGANARALEREDLPLSHRVASCARACAMSGADVAQSDGRLLSGRGAHDRPRGLRRWQPLSPHLSSYAFAMPSPVLT